MPETHLTREAILRAEDLPLHPIDIPEWGGTGYIKTLTGGEREAMEKYARDDKSNDIRAKIAVTVLSDDQGNLLFVPADIPQLVKKSGVALERVFVAAMKYNSITKEDIEAMQANL